MRFLALETNIRKLKSQFLAEGEEELLTTSRHIFAFLIPLLWIIPLSALFVVAWITGITMGLDVLVITPLLYAGLLLLLGMAIHAFIAWHYNVLIITTEKIVIVEHRFIVSQVIRPVPLENIATTDTRSQYVGLGNCGYVNIHLSEILEGTNKEIRINTLPKPGVVAGIIENARVLKSQRSPPDKGTEEQIQKVQDVQQKTVEQLPTTPPPVPPPA